MMLVYFLLLPLISTLSMIPYSVDKSIEK